MFTQNDNYHQSQIIRSKNKPHRIVANHFIPIINEQICWKFVLIFFFDNLYTSRRRLNLLDIEFTLTHSSYGKKETVISRILFEKKYLVL